MAVLSLIPAPWLMFTPTIIALHGVLELANLCQRSIGIVQLPLELGQEMLEFNLHRSVGSYLVGQVVSANRTYFHVYTINFGSLFV